MAVFLGHSQADDKTGGLVRNKARRAATRLRVCVCVATPSRERESERASLAVAMALFTNRILLRAE